MSTQHNSERMSHLAAVGLSTCKVNHDLRNILACVQLISDQLSQVEAELVRAHGGDIRLAHGLADGACFRFTIPDRRLEAEIGAEAVIDKRIAVMAG